MSKNYIYTHTETKQNYKENLSITSKQWQIYYYLFTISYYNSQTIEDHRYVYKDKINISKICKFLGISRPTFYSALEKLKENRLVRETETALLLYAKNTTSIDRELLKYLLSLTQSASKNVDLLRTYLILKKIDEIAECQEERTFCKKDLVKLLGHNVKKMEDYEQIRVYLAYLIYFGLIELKFYTKTLESLGNYTVYSIQQINTKIKNKDIIASQAEFSCSVLPQRIQNIIENSSL